VVADFVKRYQPEYTIATVSRKDFVRLSWRHGYPRLALVRDGVVRRVWEHDALPTREELDGLFGIVAERR
jgi:hypothetical protein